MSSISVRLPLNRSTSDGFEMLKTIKAAVKQNFQMLVMTNPGERVMDPNYGVGINQYLFLNFTEDAEQKIRSKLREQINIYMPMISLVAVHFQTAPDYNRMEVSIAYSVPDLGTTDLLEFTI